MNSLFSKVGISLVDYQYNYLHKRFLALWLVDEWKPLHFRTSRKAASLHCRRSRSWLAKSCGGGGEGLKNGAGGGEAGGEVPSPRPFTPPPPQLFARHERERQQCRLQSHSSFLQHYWDLGRRGLDVTTWLKLSLLCSSFSHMTLWSLEESLLCLWNCPRYDH